jgi:hypothetical protein
VEDLDVRLLAGSTDLTGLLVATAKAAAAAAGAAEEKVLNAAGVRLDLSMTDLLRRRYVADQVAINAPKLTISRRPDGSTNVGDLGEEEKESTPPSVEEVKDWVGTIKKWYGDRGSSSTRSSPRGSRSASKRRLRPVRSRA